MSTTQQTQVASTAANWVKSLPAHTSGKTLLQSPPFKIFLLVSHMAAMWLELKKPKKPCHPWRSAPVGGSVQGRGPGRGRRSPEKPSHKRGSRRSEETPAIPTEIVHLLDGGRGFRGSQEATEVVGGLRLRSETIRGSNSDPAT